MKYLIHFLTLSRLIIGPIILILILVKESYLGALILFIYASASDYLDGYFARRFNLESTIGEILDPIADKILTLFLIMTLAIFLESLFITITGLIMLSREFWVSGLRDFNARNENMFATKVTFLAKLKTTMQFISFGVFLIGITINNSLVIFLGNFIFFAAMILSIQTAITYTHASFRNDA